MAFEYEGDYVMKIKVGIIGSLETNEKIKEVLKEFQDTVEIYVYSYQHKNETPKLVQDSQKEVDVLLFSGQVPHGIAHENHLIRKPFEFIPRTGSSLYRVFWHMQAQDMDYRRVSFDTIEQEAIEETLKELEIPIDKLYVKSYRGDIDYSELIEFHHRLWKEKKINVAASCVGEVYRSLKELNVPVFRVFPTRSLIRECIHRALFKVDVEKIKGTQIAIQIVKLKNRNHRISSEYEYLKLKNQLETALISYTQEHFGSIFPFGRDEYLIFTTRGAVDIERKTFKILQLIKLQTSLEIELASGIGFGDTVHEAEVNARIALDYAAAEDCNCCYILDEKGIISGPVYEEQGEPLIYDLMVEDEAIQRMAREIKISASYVSKIQSIIQRIGRNNFEAEELANYLGISERSARRILKQIVDAGHGAICASENRTGIGRPRQIYEINL